MVPSLEQVAKVVSSRQSASRVAPAHRTNASQAATPLRQLLASLHPLRITLGYLHCRQLACLPARPVCLSVCLVCTINSSPPPPHTHTHLLDYPQPTRKHTRQPGRVVEVSRANRQRVPQSLCARLPQLFSANGNGKRVHRLCGTRWWFACDLPHHNSTWLTSAAAAAALTFVE